MLGKVETINSVKQITNITKTVKVSSMEDVYPAGFVYVQYPQRKSPSELFPTLTWQELDYSGAFFRASGTNAAPFITPSGTLSTQPQGTSTVDLSISKSGSVYGNAQGIYCEYTNWDHAHTSVATGNYVAGSAWYSYAAVYNGYGNFDGNWHAGYTSSGDPNNPSDSQNMYHSHSYTFTPSVSNDLSFAWSSEHNGDTDSETRPINYTIRIWKRV